MTPSIPQNSETFLLTETRIRVYKRHMTPLQGTRQTALKISPETVKAENAGKVVHLAPGAANPGVFNLRITQTKNKAANRQVETTAGLPAVRQDGKGIGGARKPTVQTLNSAGVWSALKAAPDEARSCKGYMTPDARVKCGNRLPAPSGMLRRNPAKTNGLYPRMSPPLPSLVVHSQSGRGPILLRAEEFGLSRLMKPRNQSLSAVLFAGPSSRSYPTLQNMIAARHFDLSVKPLAPKR